ncbi:MAG: LPS export ABC transporter periplasmic protein LptC [Candidatus Midichloriaceae bacterium]
MRYKNSIKFGLILVLVGMCISLIINYYINILETENIITPSYETSTFSKSKYETSILNPQYFFYDNEDRELFIQAKSANKMNSQIDLKSISGNVKLKNNFDFSFYAQKATLMTDKRKIFLDGKVDITNKNMIKLSSPNLLINYDNYTVSSDQKIVLSYDNIVLLASKFNLDNKQILKFTNGVKMNIKKISQKNR